MREIPKLSSPKGWGLIGSSRADVGNTAVLNSHSVYKNASTEMVVIYKNSEKQKLHIDVNSIENKRFYFQKTKTLTFSKII